jgi:hypothetical protein
MTWIYFLESNLKNEIKTSPLFQNFMVTVRTTVVTRTVPCLRKAMSSYLYKDTVATYIVTSALPSLLIYSSHERTNVNMPVATDQCMSLLWSNVSRY